MPTLEQLQQAIADWNEQYPVGTAVKLKNGFGVITETTTSSPAMLFSKTDAMIWLTGVINPVNLDRLTVDQCADTDKQTDQQTVELNRLITMAHKASRTWAKFMDHAETVEFDERREAVINKLYHRYTRRSEQTMSWARKTGLWKY